MKKSLITLAVLTTLIVGALIVAPSFIDWSAYKAQAHEQVKAKTGYDMVIGGDIRMAFLPFPHINLRDVQLISPQSTRDVPLAAFKELSVSVAIAPLFKKQIQVDTVTLKSPRINIESDKTGIMNWMTPQVEALMQGSGNRPASGNSNVADAVSLDRLVIEDGRFSFYDGKQNKTTVIENMDLELKADTLLGPYDFNGALNFAGNEVSYEGETQRYSPETKSIVIKLDSKIAPHDVKVHYTGVVSLENGFEAQGETALALILPKGAASPLAGKPVNAKGLLTVTADSASYKDLLISLDGTQFVGAVSAGLKPLSISADLKGQDALNLDALLPAVSGGNKAAPTLNILPQTLSLPAGLSLELSVSVPSVLYKAQKLGQATLAAGKKAGTMPFAVSVSGIPGEAKADVKGALVYGSSSVSSKTGAEIFSDPSLSATVNASTQNLPFTAQSFLGETADIGPAASWRAAEIAAPVSLKGNNVGVSNATVKLDDTTFGLSASYEDKKPRPLLSVAVNSNRLDWDALSAKLFPPKAAEKKEGLDSRTAAKSLALPYDLALGVDIKSLKYNQSTLGGVGVQASIRENQLSIQKMNISDFAQSNISVSGKIADIRALSGIDGNVALKSVNVAALAAAFGGDASSVPAGLKRLDVNADVTGNAERINVKSNIDIQGLALALAGAVDQPLSPKPSVSDMDVQVKHSNTNDAIRIFNPNFTRSNSLSKPMNVTTTIKRENEVYTLSDLKGDIAGANLVGIVSLDMSKPKPYLKGDLRLGSLVIDPDAKKSSGGAGSGNGGAASKSSVRWSREAVNTDWMHNMNMDLTMVAAALTYGPWALAEPAMQMSLRDGKLDLSKLNAKLYGGNMDMNAVVQSFEDRRKPIQISSKAQFANVDLEQMVGALAGNKLIKSRGTVSMNTELSTIGLSPAAFVSDLRGGGTVTGQNIVLEGLDLARFGRALSDDTKPGDSLLGLWKGTTSGGSTQFDTLDGQYNIQEGIVNITKLALDGPKAAIGTTGQVDLPRWTIATKHNIAVKEPADIPPFDIEIRGPLDNPAQTFGQGALQNYFSRKLNRKLESLITDKLGLPSAPAQQNSEQGGAAPQQQPKQQITPEDAIRGVLDGFLR